MAEREVTFSAMPTPSWDTFKTVTISAGIGFTSFNGHASVSRDVAVADARAFAEQILAACNIVEGDK